MPRILSVATKRLLRTNCVSFALFVGFVVSPGLTEKLSTGSAKPTTATVADDTTLPNASLTLRGFVFQTGSLTRRVKKNEGPSEHA